MASCEIKKIPESNEMGRIIKEEMVDQFCENFVLVGKEETVMPMYYANFSEAIKNFEVRNSDIMVVTYPKTGTTWTQEMVWMIANNLDFKGGEITLDERFPHFELCTLYDYKKMEKFYGNAIPDFVKESVHYAAELDNPRFIKTHLPFSLLPQDIQNGSKTPKIIYVVRNPKDVCISYYHHGKLLQGWRANLANFSKLFLADKAMYGSFWKHIFGFWERRNSPNILIISYEEMKKDLRSIIKRVAEFLNKTLTNEQMEVLLKHLSFESMKNNKAVNCEDTLENRRKNNLLLEEGSFIRSGTVGKYKEEMSPEIIAQFNAWIKNNIIGTSFAGTYNYEV